MSENRDPRCVFIAEHRPAAESVAEWLANQGYPCTVDGPGILPPAADGLGFTEPPANVLEVRVVNPDHVEPALAVLAAHPDVVASIQSRDQLRPPRTGTVTAVCEECGKSSDWDATLMGTTEDCPHCGAYMDIPDPDEKWDDDFESGAEELTPT